MVRLPMRVGHICKTGQYGLVLEGSLKIITTVLLKQTQHDSNLNMLGWISFSACFVFCN